MRFTPEASVKTHRFDAMPCLCMALWSDWDTGTPALVK